jgi:hypothetical protein
MKERERTRVARRDHADAFPPAQGAGKVLSFQMQLADTR